jgi:hypothetical protein
MFILTAVIGSVIILSNVEDKIGRPAFSAVIFPRVVQLILPTIPYRR